MKKIKLRKPQKESPKNVKCYFAEIFLSGPPGYTSAAGTNGAGADSGATLKKEDLDWLKRFIQSWL